MKSSDSTQLRARAKVITGSFVEQTYSLTKQALSDLDDIFNESTLIFSESLPILEETYLQKLSVKYPEFTELQLKICALFKVYYTQAEVTRMLGLSANQIHNELIDIQLKMRLSLPGMVEGALQQELH